MENWGLATYKETNFLNNDKSTQAQESRVATIIAHEIAHMWFGNLVTMRWFNDVWLKEVFAGLMADKIVNPQFPEVNHQLSFQELILASLASLVAGLVLQPSDPSFFVHKTITQNKLQYS